jgi:uncharacterized protein with FMN-binding domain
MIKKIAVGVFVTLTFFIYSFYQRSEGNQAVSQVVSNTKKTSQASTPATSSSSSSTTSTPSNTYKDGSYTGKSSDAIYGYIQVRTTISGGKLTDVEFLDYPQDRRNSVEINNYAMPQLKSQAIRAQSAQVDGVSGATDTSQAFIESLGDALSQAKA